MRFLCCCQDANRSQIVFPFSVSSEGLPPRGFYINWYRDILTLPIAFSPTLDLDFLNEAFDSIRFNYRSCWKQVERLAIPLKSAPQVSCPLPWGKVPAEWASVSWAPCSCSASRLPSNLLWIRIGMYHFLMFLRDIFKVTW